MGCVCFFDLSQGDLSFSNLANLHIGLLCLCSGAKTHMVTIKMPGHEGLPNFPDYEH